jgi:hypothetical protein
VASQGRLGQTGRYRRLSVRAQRACQTPRQNPRTIGVSRRIVRLARQDRPGPSLVRQSRRAAGGFVDLAHPSRQRARCGSRGSADVSVQPVGQPIMKRLAIWYRIERLGVLLERDAPDATSPLSCCRGGVVAMGNRRAASAPSGALGSGRPVDVRERRAGVGGRATHLRPRRCR